MLMLLLLLSAWQKLARGKPKHMADSIKTTQDLTVITRPTGVELNQVGRMRGAEPLPPTKPGGWWCAVMLDRDDCLWLTGTVWADEDAARLDGERTALEWNTPKPAARWWWQFWKWGGGERGEVRTRETA